MASRGFYLVSAALLGGTALIAWLGLRGGSAPAPGSSSAAASSDDDPARALGVVAGVSDPAQGSRRGDPSTITAPRTGTPTLAAVPPPRQPTPPGPPTPVPSAPDPAAELTAEVQPMVLAAVSSDLERRRGALRERCWPAGSDAAATFTVEATYGADGGLLALGVPDVHGLPGVGSCLMGQIGQDPPRLPEAPGVNVAVRVPLEFAGSGAPAARPTPTARSRDE